MESLKYKGYSGSIEYSKADNCLHGKVIGLDKGTCITYEGDTALELYEDFKGAIDDYLDYCKDKGIQPKTFSPSTETFSKVFLSANFAKSVFTPKHSTQNNHSIPQ